MTSEIDGECVSLDALKDFKFSGSSRLLTLFFYIGSIRTGFLD